MRGLRTTDVVQRGVELPLDDTGEVVRRTAVPEDDQAAGPAQDVPDAGRPTARSTSRSLNGMTGQSFHSRSRA